MTYSRQRHNTNNKNTRFPMLVQKVNTWSCGKDIFVVCLADVRFHVPFRTNYKIHFILFIESILCMAFQSGWHGQNWIQIYHLGPSIVRHFVWLAAVRRFVFLFHSEHAGQFFNRWHHNLIFSFRFLFMVSLFHDHLYFMFFIGLSRFK